VPVVPVRDLRVSAAAGAIGSTISGHSAQMLLARNAGSAHLAGLDEDEGGRSRTGSAAPIHFTGHGRVGEVVVGAALKPGSDDVRDSPALAASWPCLRASGVIPAALPS
jgi:hypothetical protein